MTHTTTTTTLEQYNEFGARSPVWAEMTAPKPGEFHNLMLSEVTEGGAR